MQAASGQELRWQQRLNNYTLAMRQLAEAVELAAQRPLSALERLGLAHIFEFTHELAWNVLKDYFFWQGNAAITGSRDATREAFAQGLLDDGEGWMAMIKSRNLSSHTYNQSVADSIAEAVTARYYPLMRTFEMRMRALEGASHPRPRGGREPLRPSSSGSESGGSGCGLLSRSTFGQGVRLSRQGQLSERLGS